MIEKEDGWNELNIKIFKRKQIRRIRRISQGATKIHQIRKDLVVKIELRSVIKKDKVCICNQVIHLLLSNNCNSEPKSLNRVGLTAIL